MSMQIRALADVLRMQDGEPISAVQGTVKSIFKRNAGENSHGPWSMQNLVIHDGATEMKVVIKDRDALPTNLKGKQLRIESNLGDRGMTGMKANDNEYPKGSNKFTREVYVTPSAHIYIDNAPYGGAKNYVAPPTTQSQQQPQQQPPQQQHQPPAQQQQQPANTASRGTNHAGNEEAVNQFRTFLARRANGWALCRIVAVKKAQQVKEVTGSEVPEDAIQAATASLFISADRGGMLDNFPSSDLTEFFRK